MKPGKVPNMVTEIPERKMGRPVKVRDPVRFQALLSGACYDGVKRVQQDEDLTSEQDALRLLLTEALSARGLLPLRK